MQQARLEVAGKVISPEGARDLRVSTNQAFRISYKINNLGMTGTDSTSQIVVRLPISENFTFDSLGTIVLTDTLYIFTDDSVETDVYTLDSTTVTPEAIIADITPSRAAIDTNSNQPAQVVGSDITRITIVEEANLFLEITSVPNTISQNQNFVLEGLLSNLGGAGIGPDSTVIVTLDTL